MKRVLTLLFVACLWLAIGCGGGYKTPLVQTPGTPVVININAADSAGQLDHAWEFIAGSGHAGLYIREGWSDKMLAHLGDVHDNLGIQMVRFHGIFLDEVGIYQGPGNYDFSRSDRVFDGILAAGVKPFLELSFVPREMASGWARGFPLGYKPYISPPESYQEWANMVGALVEHLVERYGIDEVRTWYFEVWNEPNLPFFWSGDMDDYMLLYDLTAAAVKAVDPGLRVGGPSTSQGEWIWDLLEHCRKTGTPVDFITTHVYGTEDTSKQQGQSESAGVSFKINEQGRVFYEQVRQSNKIIQAGEQGPLPLFITEWNSSVVYSYKMFPGFNDHDLPNDAAFMCKAVKDVNGQTAGFSHWTYSDVFEEWGMPGEHWPIKNPTFHGGFGLITVDGIHKPSYHAFTFLHRLGTNMLDTQVIADRQGIDALATLDEGKLGILVWYYLDTMIERETKGPVAQTELNLNNLPRSLMGKKLIAYRIDQDHGNPFAEWIEMGKPKQLPAAQLDQLKSTSDDTLRAPESDSEIDGENLTLSFELPPAGIIFLTTAD